MKQARIEIPRDAERCVVLMRHSFSVQEGDDRTRTLTRDGVARCYQVVSDYSKLLGRLQTQYGGETEYVASGFPRSLLSCFLVTYATQISRDPRLNVDVYLKKAPAPEGSPHPNLRAHWEAEGLSKGEMLARAANDPKLFGNQPAKDMLRRMHAFITEQHGMARVVFAVGHEHNISLTAASYGVPADLLDLQECGAFIFFVAKWWRVVSVQKFTPLALSR